MKSLFAVVSTIALLSFKSNCIKKFLHSNWCQASETISLIRYGQRNNKVSRRYQDMMSLFCCCFYHASLIQNYSKNFLPAKYCFSFPDCCVVLSGRILARNLPWNWSMKSHLSRLREELLPAKEVNLNILLPFLLQVFVSCFGIILLPLRMNLPEYSSFLLKQTLILLLDIQLSTYALICPSQRYASTVVYALFKIIIIRAASRGFLH